MRIEDALGRLFDGRSLSQAETGAVFRQVMSGEATPAQIGGLLAALRVKEKPRRKWPAPPGPCASSPPGWRWMSPT